jgi:hypothetical protein
MGNAAEFSWKDVLIPGAINTVINGFTGWKGFKGMEQVALTVDSIAEGSHTAFGGAVMTAAGMGLVLSLINFAIVSKHAGGEPMERRESFRAALGMGLKNAIFLFGLLACTALLWQRFFGTVHVSPFTATLLTALIAGAVSVYLGLNIRVRHKALMA